MVSQRFEPSVSLLGLCLHCEKYNFKLSSPQFGFYLWLL